MKRILKICLLVFVGVPLFIVLLIAVLIFLGNRFAQTDKEIQSTMSKHSSTKEECVSWLQSTKRPFSGSPLAEDALPPGTAIDEIEGASSVIDVTFGTRGEVPKTFTEATPCDAGFSTMKRANFCGRNLNRIILVYKQIPWFSNDLPRVLESVIPIRRPRRRNRRGDACCQRREGGCHHLQAGQ